MSRLPYHIVYSLRLSFRLVLFMRQIYSCVVPLFKKSYTNRGFQDVNSGFHQDESTISHYTLCYYCRRNKWLVRNDQPLYILYIPCIVKAYRLLFHGMHALRCPCKGIRGIATFQWFAVNFRVLQAGTAICICSAKRTILTWP